MLKIGHRGAAGHAPENSLASFKKAIDLGVDMVEFDVHVCESGEPVVFHDKNLKRITGSKTFIRKKSLEELKAFDIGRGEKIPTLEEVLDLINKKAKVNIEIKAKGTAEPVRKIIKKYIKKYRWKKNYFLVSSFDHKELRIMKKIFPSLNIGFLFKRSAARPGIIAKRGGAYSAHLNYRVATKKTVDRLHKKGLRVFVYTVNEKKDIERMKNFGVDGIFSDFPEKLFKNSCRG